jgi:hypothetical protein
MFFYDHNILLILTLKNYHKRKGAQQVEVREKGVGELHTVFLVTAKSWTLELLAFDEYCRFDNSAFVKHINRGSLYT